MPPPIPRCSSWAYSSLNSPSHFNLPRYGRRVGLHIVLFEACSTFTRVAACTLALSPIRDTLIDGFSHFVTSMTAPIASGWSDCRVGFSPTGKRRLCTAHTHLGHWAIGHRLIFLLDSYLISRPRCVLSEERVEPRLAAILAADVAGYSRLMGANEEGTLAQ